MRCPEKWPPTIGTGKSRFFEKGALEIVVASEFIKKMASTSGWLAMVVRVIMFATVIFLNSSVESQSASAPTKVVGSYSAMNARVAPLWIAQDQGYFKKYGTDIDAVFIRTGPLQVASLVSGDTDIGYGCDECCGGQPGADLI